MLHFSRHCTVYALQCSVSGLYAILKIVIFNMSLILMIALNQGFVQNGLILLLLAEYSMSTMCKM